MSKVRVCTYVRIIIAMSELTIQKHIDPPRHSLPFTAHLVHGSDPDITVTPTSGELTSVNGKGTLFFITYKPQTYVRDHRAKLVVQVRMYMYMYVCS